MEVVWKVHCDVYVEEYDSRTNARTSQWQLKESRVIVEDESDARSSVLYVPRHGVSIPIKLLGADFSVHMNFLAEGKCSIRVRKPMNLCLMMSKIPPHHLQAVVHLLNAVQASRLGRPNGLTSTTVTGEGDYHKNDKDDMKRKKPAPVKKPVAPTSTQPAGMNKAKQPTLDDDVGQASEEDEDDEEDKENLSPASKRRMAVGKAQTQMVRQLVATKNGMPAGSPKRFLSPQGVKFLQLNKTERQRVLAAHPGLHAKRQSRFRNDPTWAEREHLFDVALGDPSVSLEQRQVLLAVFQGKSVFFTGSAGTGKSFLIHKILSCLPGLGVQTHATSTTGITAMAIQGQTIYAWAGLGVLSGKEQSHELAQRVQRNRETFMRWTQTRTLLIDEVSMLDGSTLQSLHEVAQIVRGSKAPFGGIQLLLCGDFLQLPPVCSSGQTKPFAFECSCWSEVIQETIELGQVFRQKSGKFIDILNDLRRGLCTQDAEVRLKQCESTNLQSMYDSDGIKPTTLLTLKSEVDSLNAKELRELPGQIQSFQARDIGVGNAMDSLRSNCPARAQLDLKIGAQVILLKNLSVAEGLCNGSRGVVLKFAQGTRHPVVRFASSGAEHTITPATWSVASAGKITASREQLPLDLAWSLSIHKSQGMSLDRARIDLSKVFEYGQAYVALSRLRSLEGLQLFGFDSSKIKAHPKVLAFYDRLSAQRVADENARAKIKRLSPNTMRRLDMGRSPPSSDEKQLSTASKKNQAASTNTAVTRTADPKVTVTVKRKADTDEPKDSDDEEGVQVQKRLIFRPKKKRRLIDSSSSSSSEDEAPMEIEMGLPRLESIETIVSASQSVSNSSSTASTVSVAKSPMDAKQPSLPAPAVPSKPSFWNKQDAGPSLMSRSSLFMHMENATQTA